MGEPFIRIFTYSFLVLAAVALRKGWEYSRSPAAAPALFAPSRSKKGHRKALLPESPAVSAALKDEGAAGEEPGGTLPSRSQAEGQAAPAEFSRLWLAVGLGWPLAAALEVWLLRPAFRGWLAVAGLLVWGVSLLIKYKVADVLGSRWRLEGEAGLEVVTQGPYQRLRHPEYLAELLEVASVCLLTGAYFILFPALGAVGWLVFRQMGREEAQLMERPEYLHHFSSKKRLWPGVY